jgi:hypothetical protein
MTGESEPSLSQDRVFAHYDTAEKIARDEDRLRSAG